MTMGKLVLIVLALCVCSAKAAAIARDSTYRHKVKLDLAPLYYGLFDVRQQLRIGAEYEHTLGTKTFATFQFDAGLYDNYTYTKYNGFFDQTGGRSKTVQKVLTWGFHLLPSLNRMLSNTSRYKRRQIYIGMTADFNRFFKKSVTTENGTCNTALNAQTKFGMGINLGMRYRIRKQWYIDLKGIFIHRLFYINSQSGMKDIKPYKAVWFNKAMSCWLIPDINICYAF